MLAPEGGLFKGLQDANMLPNRREPGANGETHGLRARRRTITYIRYAESETMLIPQTGSQPSRLTAPDEDEIRAELEAILASPAFLRSERQSQFLRFVCDTALKGGGAKLNEYVIAHEVFGRGNGYSPGEDSVVRRQAHSLRQKLHDYYVREALHHRDVAFVEIKRISRKDHN